MKKTEAIFEHLESSLTLLANFGADFYDSNHARGFLQKLYAITASTRMTVLIR